VSLLRLEENLMVFDRMTHAPFFQRGCKIRLSKMALLLICSLALTAWAADDRAVKSRVAPVYPDIAKRMKIFGEVKLDVTVSSDGKVKDVKAISGNHLLGVAAEDAVRKWTFETGSGETTSVVVVNFAP
jgi:TonB family protein